MSPEKGGFLGRWVKGSGDGLETATVESPAPKKGFFAKVRDRLTQTKSSLVSQTLTLLKIRGKIDGELLDEMEEALISADVGVETSLQIVEAIRERAASEKPSEEEASDWLGKVFHDLILEQIGDEAPSLDLPDPLNVILVVGVNGVGKTTTIGKLANRLRLEGKKVVIAAADTFRAAAVEQLRVWSERSGSQIVEGADGADPASVVYNAIEKAKGEGADVVIVDTAGRLHNKANLMKELEKIGRIIGREVEGAPQESLLVLDASTGQNGLTQAKVFKEMVPITGIVLTKLDGTAKGGVILSVKGALGIPVKLAGLGEQMDDLEPFDPKAFVGALFADAQE